MKNSRSNLSARNAERQRLNSAMAVRVPRDYPWKILGTLTEDLRDCLTNEEFKQVIDIVRSRDFKAYLELGEAWGPQSSSPIDTSCSNFAAKYQIISLLKKYQFPTDRKARRAAAYEKFIQAEAKCKDFNENRWKNLAFLTEQDELHIFTYAKRFLSSLLGEELPPSGKLTLWSRHGPGSNLDTKERRISLYDKYSGWPYSCTSGARSLAIAAIQDDERWLGALEDDYRRKKGIEPWRILDQDVFWSNVINIVPGNKITFVPKNSLTDRSIAIEPCMNLYLQLGVDGYIRRRLKRFGVDLDSQDKNQILAREGSKNWTDQDSYVTLDLAAASDTISLELCRVLLPPQWFTYLIRLRSPVGVCNDEVISYEKISSMGNGYTFALESAIFTSVIYGVERYLRGQFRKEDVAIFGDDLIVRKRSSDLVVKMLNLFGFSINREKSFVDGPFRESCGADWFRGTPVRPVFLSSNPATVMELWTDLNRLRRILSLRLMGFEFKVCELIRTWIPEIFNRFTGPCSDIDFDSYMHVPRPTSRYVRGMWKFERLVAIPNRLNGDSFLFRKLMHPLRDKAAPRPYYSPQYGGLKLSGAGSVFTVTGPGSVTVSHTFSLASFWQDEYNAVVSKSKDS